MEQENINKIKELVGGKAGALNVTVARKYVREGTDGETWVFKTTVTKSDALEAAIDCFRVDSPIEKDWKLTPFGNTRNSGKRPLYRGYFVNLACELGLDWLLPRGKEVNLRFTNASDIETLERYTRDSLPQLFKSAMNLLVREEGTTKFTLKAVVEEE